MQENQNKLTQIEKLPITLFFKTTNVCDLSCSFCCEQSNPHQSKTYLPDDIVKYYLDESKNENVHKVIFYGGEPTMPDRFEKRDYIFPLVQYALDKSFKNIALKTNMVWMNDYTIRQRLLPQMMALQRKETRRFTIDVSVDKGSQGCKRAFTNLIKEIKENGNSTEFQILVSSIKGCENLVDKIMKNNGVKLKQSGGKFAKYFIGDIEIYVVFADIFEPSYEFNPLLKKETIEYLNNTAEMALTHDGYACWVVGGFRGIHTKWQDTHGEPKPLGQIKQELINQIKTLVR